MKPKFPIFVLIDNELHPLKTEKELSDYVQERLQGAFYTKYGRYLGTTKVDVTFKRLPEYDQDPWWVSQRIQPQADSFMTSERTITYVPRKRGGK